MSTVCKFLSINELFCKRQIAVIKFVITTPVYRAFLCRFCPSFVLWGGTKNANKNKELEALETWPRGLRRRFAKPIRDIFRHPLNPQYFNYLDRERGRQRDAAVANFVPTHSPRKRRRKCQFLATE